MTTARPITLLREIQAQPEIFLQLLEAYTADKHFPYLGEHIQRLVGIAEGSSGHALEIATPFLEAWLKVPVNVMTPERLSEKAEASMGTTGLEGIDPQYWKDTGIIGVSQSGETASLLRVLASLKQQLPDLPLFSVTNKVPSSLSELSQNTFDILAGPEASIAATKTMTASVFTLLLWGLLSAKHLKRMDTKVYKRLHQQLQDIPAAVSRLWENGNLKRLHQFAKRLLEVNHFVLLSKGLLTVMLPEAGLKLTETSRNIVYTNNTESFKHGPKVILNGVNEEHPNSLYLVPPDAAMAEGLYRDLRSHFWIAPFQPEETLAFEDDRVFFVLFENSPGVPEAIYKGLSLDDDRILTLPKSNTIFESLFMGLTAFQLISYYVALGKGENPNDPALEKAVVQ